MSKKHAVVIGSGVIGLQSAICLLEAGYRVTIVAEHFPGDESLEYTSPWAGAQWRSHAALGDVEQQSWDMATYNEWTQLLKNEHADSRLARSGIEELESYQMWDSNNEPKESLWWAPLVRNFRGISPLVDPVSETNARSTSGKPIHMAAAFTAYAINVPVYLEYLLSKYKSLGGNAIRSKIPSDKSLASAIRALREDMLPSRKLPKPDVLINATGLAARHFCPDDKAIHPIRGQIVLVKGEVPAMRMRHGKGYESFCVPRPGSGTTIIGGVKEPDSWDGKVDDALTKKILDRAKAIAPELCTGPDGGFEIVKVWVGFRPGRRGGARHERERVGGTEVVHAYGHGGAGYQNSVGVGRLVTKLVNEAVGSSAARL